MTNSVDPDQPTDLDLDFLLRYSAREGLNIARINTVFHTKSSSRILTPDYRYLIGPRWLLLVVFFYSTSDRH